MSLKETPGFWTLPEPAHEVTTNHYGIILADGKFRQCLDMPQLYNSRDRAWQETIEDRQAMQRANIPESMWPRIVKVKKTISFHSVEEIEES